MTFWTKSTGGILLALVALSLYQQSAGHLPSGPAPVGKHCESEEKDPEGQDIIIHGDDNGHFRGHILVNGISMPFLIDTGATSIAIPASLAKMAKLPVGKINVVSTANGLTEVRSSVIDELKLENAVIKNAEAFIGDQLDEVLLGMSALKHFQMRLENNTLILTANKGYSIGVTEVTKWKKNVVCDSVSGECKTSYGHDR